MPGFRHEEEEFAYGHDMSIDAHPDDYAWSEWTVYSSSSYEVGGGQGRRYLYVSEDEAGEWFADKRRYKPLSRQSAFLFLEFAGWPEEHGMDKKPLGSEKNETAALEWATTYGVLGLDSPDFEVNSSAGGVLRHVLGRWGGIRARTRNEAKGGLKETVEAFAREAWVANTTLRMYEAATGPEGPDMDALGTYMPDKRSLGMPSIKDLYDSEPEAARGWALRIVGEIVEDKLRDHAWAVPVRDGLSNGYSRGWAFDSLLGAMWLQMSWLMFSNAERCEWCGKLLNIELEWAMSLPKAPQNTGGKPSVERLLSDAKDFALLNKPPRKPRSDRRFCKNSGCRAAWNYHRSAGKSSKAARKERRESGGS